MKKDLILREKLAIQRTHLANQTTYLAFLRSSMYFLVAGLTVYRFSNHPYSKLFSIILLVGSAGLLIGGTINYLINKAKIERNKIHIGGFKFEYLEDKEKYFDMDEG